MKKLLAVAFACPFFFFGCTKSNSSLTPIQQVGCDIETAVSSSFAGGVAAALSCSNLSVIQADLQKAFGNANLCQGPVASATTAQLKSAKAQLVHKMGAIGNIACPIAVPTALGFLSNSIPSGWGCSASASASALSSTLITLCEAAIPL